MATAFNLLPLLNEKTYELSKSKNVYVFKVPSSVNKQSLTSAIKDQFKVEVLSVNTTNSKGKTKRVMSLTGRRAANAYGKRPDYKKAYVTLKSGDSLPFFESIDEAEAKRESSQTKFDQAAQKLADKETKTLKPDTSIKRRFLRTKKPEGS